MGRCKCGEMLIIVEPGGWELTVQLKTFSVYKKSKPEKVWEMPVFWCQNDMWLSAKPVITPPSSVLKRASVESGKTRW